MEVPHCAQDVGSHAVSLLAYLNIQREQAHFCDCVLIQRQSPAQLYPAHRCVLAASSPVLASILSSTGALVELQAPCLSDAVLTPLLDYIYTGALPFTHSQQQYYSLLNAACYLQMIELQEALRAWQQTEASAAENADASPGAETQPYKGNKKTSRTTMNIFSDLPLTPSSDAFRRLEETDTFSVQSATSSPEREAHEYSATVETFNESQMHSTSRDSRDEEIVMSRNSSKHGSNKCSTSDANSLSTESNANAGDYRQAPHLTRQDLIQNITGIAERHDMSEVDKEVRKDQFHLTAIVKPEIWQKSKGEELMRTTEDRRSSSLSPHPSCGAVPVICHSSRVAVLQLAEVSAVPPYHPASLAAGSSSRASVSRSASTDNDSIVESFSTKHESQHGAQSLDNKHNNHHTLTHSQDYRDISAQCATQDFSYKFSAGRSDVSKEDYNSSNTDCFIIQNKEHIRKGLPHNTEHLRDDSVPQNTDRNKWLKSRSDLSIDGFPSKHKRLDCFECYNVSLATATEELSQDPRAAVSLPVEHSDTQRDSHCKDLCAEGEAKEEHCNSRRYSAEMDVHDSHCNLDVNKINWYSNIHGIGKSTKDSASSQNEHDSNCRHTAMQSRAHSVDLCLPVSITPGSSLDNVTGRRSPFECRSSVEPEQTLGTETTEPHLSLSVGQSYHGHLHYHCLPQDNMHLSHGDPDQKHPQANHPDHSGKSSDDEVSTSASPGLSPLKQHFATGATDQVLLLDISTKPAELIVSCKHRSDREEIEVGEKDTFETRIRNHDRVQRKEATARDEMKKMRARTESLDETTSWGGQANIDKRKSVGKDQSRPGAEVIQKAGVMEVVENQISAWTPCAAPPVSDSAQVSMPSTSSVCIPSTLSASVPSNISAHLSSPAHHPFQCSLCDRSFSQRGSLNRHVRSHLGVRPFPCPHCPMTFSRQYRVTEHMRVHQRCTLGTDFEKPPASSM
ncbi:uncharacterized protein LOC111587968 [Amphiprion ocellaris]|uniref:Uncharacterized protein n=2 Tax=Amphiprion ocellaris TaxID=80972 RepID=A0A3Q1BK21_AMPOC|nr:uncharacterized protein LOC111587968 [Amphiprion ocellaris]XP_054869711.1 uncharacterized protein LOC111587968 [Amphiprion ocellaris]XP_054869712.1 uncharacterized protein LOC111587968 [Amphiprion ocellaris]XP_054869715.1 uncharacterized protein LOC111587968 [Amphiprion ocellaris]XP_054869717.1 uncharacterized protein LOC111587968 [Amphiprion ocellaris]